MATFKKTPDLEDDQKFALMKFRRSVADILRPEHDDYFLLRWLRARKWNAEAAEKMLRDAHKNRIMWDVDNLEKWNRPQVLVDYCPHGLTGFDNEGSPIVIIPFAGMDMYGMLHCVTRFDFMRSTVLYLERYMKVAFEQSKIYGPQARQFVVIFDMEHFNLKQYAWRPAAELVLFLVKNYELNYPEILKICYIINAPKIFSVAFNFVKKFLDENTMSKIQIHKQGSEKWQKNLFSHCDSSQIPKYYGGTLTDEDGDPKCKSKICWAGKIPKELYNKRDDDEQNDNENFVDATINKGGKIKLEFMTENENGTILRWEFRTFEHDIKFGIRSIDNKTQEKLDEVPLGRVSSHEIDEIGFINCRPNTKYIVVFDNSYSYLKSKKIRYNVDLTRGLEEIEQISEEMLTTQL
ncbi:SEC14-like protein 2 [Condylostylus longicornis]|uniref:SEC14-like protein 2 n=1 Tax=Condylostylus longicornis TaxID=2530218 RepID=UPI00244E3EB5|nr:SEC14-like protein 2 [Condylostylus longicornis]XP_055377017.1 SEC14-like protein 2 [Condylostylus longicornis]XP_055377018.1 SEC14-like protein 2 [Condylostylus longicornis]